MTETRTATARRPGGATTGGSSGARRPDRAEAGTWPVRERSLVSPVLGIPPVIAVVLAMGLTALGVLIDLLRLGTVGSVFQIAYGVGCVLAVSWVRRRSIFVPAIQPPLLLAVVVPVLAVLVGSPSSTAGLTEHLLLAGAPLINAFPAMAVTTGLVLLVAGFRLLRQRTGPDDAVGRLRGRLSGGSRGAGSTDAGSTGSGSSGLGSSGSRSPGSGAEPGSGSGSGARAARATGARLRGDAAADRKAPGGPDRRRTGTDRGGSSRGRGTGRAGGRDDSGGRGAGRAGRSAPTTDGRSAAQTSSGRATGGRPTDRTSNQGSSSRPARESVPDPARSAKDAAAAERRASWLRPGRPADGSAGTPDTATGSSSARRAERPSTGRDTGDRATGRDRSGRPTSARSGGTTGDRGRTRRPRRDAP